MVKLNCGILLTPHRVYSKFFFNLKPSLHAVSAKLKQNCDIWSGDSISCHLDLDRSYGDSIPPCMASSESSFYLGIDIGTGSARAALVKTDGTILASASQETRMWRDPTDHRIFEQSTANIWNSICLAVQEVIARSKVSPKHIKGIGFDATCSLAVTSWEGEPIMVTRGAQLGEPGERNVVLWADHRAEKEADLINSTGSSVLDYVGGTISVRLLSPPARLVCAGQEVPRSDSSSRWRSRRYSG